MAEQSKCGSLNIGTSSYLAQYMNGIHAWLLTHVVHEYNSYLPSSDISSSVSKSNSSMLQWSYIIIHIIMKNEP